MTSGQMWNHIRGPPYAHKNPQNGQVVSWFFHFEGKYDIDSNFLHWVYNCKQLQFHGTESQSVGVLSLQLQAESVLEFQMFR